MIDKRGILDEVDRVEASGLIPFALIIPITPQLLMETSISEEELLFKFDEACTTVLQNLVSPT